MLNWNKYKEGDMLRVVAYGRVSTEHEAQLSALENQMQWYSEQVKQHKHDWTLVAPITTYMDRGITGTQAKKRDGFLRMIEDAKSGKFDMIITREVCRFARNTAEALTYVEQLREINVEVYFINDNIRTISNKHDELKLSIMSMLAQEESHKVSERALAGQEISRKNGVLYGTSNVLGYNRIRRKSDDDKRNRIGDKSVPTFEIDPEQADTVKMIFEWYMQGYGLKKIKILLQQNGRKTAQGNSTWHESNISRVLENPMYIGKQYQCQTSTISYLTGKKVKNPKEDWVLIPGDFEPIIDEDVFEAVQILKSERKKNNTFNGTEGGNGKPSSDKWIRKLECNCGSRFRKYKWRTDKETGDQIKGYTCSHKVNNGSEAYRLERGLDTKGSCSLRSIPDWHLELQGLRVFSSMFGDSKEGIIRAVKSVEACNQADYNGRSIIDLERERDKYVKKLDALIELATDGGITKDRFLIKQAEYQENIDFCDKEIVKAQTEVGGDKHDIKTKRIIDCLGGSVNVQGKYIEEQLIENMVDRIVMRDNYEFEWLVNLSGDASEFISEKHRCKPTDPVEKKRETAIRVRDDLYIHLYSFTINFDAARNYRKQWGKYLRTNQWEDIKVHIYLR